MWAFTSPDELDALATHKDPEVRQAVACNMATPADTLHQLAGDPNQEVRLRAAANPSTPRDTLTDLALNGRGWVSVSAIGNPSTPNHVIPRALDKLARSRTEGVLLFVVAHPLTPAGTVARLVGLTGHVRRITSTTTHRAILAGQLPQLSQELLGRLSRDRDERVRTAVARNKNLPELLTIQLAADPSSSVRAAIAARRDLPDDARILLALADTQPDTDDDAR